MRNCLCRPHPGFRPQERRRGQGHRLAYGAQGPGGPGVRARPRDHEATGAAHGYGGSDLGPTDLVFGGCGNAADGVERLARRGLGWRKRCFGAADTNPHGPQGPPRICRQEPGLSRTSVRGGLEPNRRGRKTDGAARRAARTELRQSPDRPFSSNAVRGCARKSRASATGSTP